MQEQPTSEPPTSEPRVVGGDLVPIAHGLVPASPPEALVAVPGAPSRRPRWLKPIAGILIAYGVAGLMMAVILLVVGLQVWPVLQMLTTQIAGSLRATAITVGTAAAAAGGASTSLDQARQVTAAAAQTALQARDNVRQLAQTLEYSDPRRPTFRRSGAALQRHGRQPATTRRQPGRARASRWPKTARKRRQCKPT